ncbi:hypothetical protein [Trujillonella humicola]|uniref:hypothetical protein n=1 Tax=Trujillonella humicola TaxID=3383699 RepID=UPI0039068170
MLRTTAVVLYLCLVVAVTGTWVTGQFWVSVVATAGVLVSGAVALSLSRWTADDEAGDTAEVHHLVPPHGSPRSAAYREGAGGLGRAA